MTLQEAYVKARRSDNAYENAYLVECKDYGDLWGFAFSPIPYDPEDPHTWVGGGYTTVDKKTGTIGGINAIASWELKGENIPLKQLAGLIRPLAKTKKMQSRIQSAAVAS